MKILRTILLIFVVISLCSCNNIRQEDIKEEKNFSQSTMLTVYNLNDQNSENIKDYYYIEGNKINKFSIDNDTIETVCESKHEIINCKIEGDYIYYNCIYDQNSYGLNRYNISSKTDECVLDESIISCKNFDIYKGYIYILTNSYSKLGASVYRLPINGNVNSSLENLNELYIDYEKNGEVQQVIVDGVIVESYYDLEHQERYILSIRESESNNVILISQKEEVLVGKKRVIISSEHKETQKQFTYQIEGMEQNMIDCLSRDMYKNSKLHEIYMCQESKNTLIGMLSISQDPRVNIHMYQNSIESDILFRLNIDTGESEIIYDTQDNKTKIIGFDKGTVFLLKNDYKIYAQSIGGEMLEIASVPEGDSMIFEWYGDNLIIRYRNGWDEYSIKHINKNNK